MCTVSWAPADEGYTVLFNRDEQRARRAAVFPGVRVRRGVAFVSPVDPDGGGTWITANDRGLTVCLLNEYPTSPPAVAQPVSRGLLVDSLAAVRSGAEAEATFLGWELGRFRPFVLVVFDAGRRPLLLRWNGTSREKGLGNGAGLVATSSSADPIGARLARSAMFARALSSAPGNPDRLALIHASHGDPDGIRSVCVHRPRVETVSLTRVDVARGLIRFVYTPGPPCCTEALSPVAIRRTPRAWHPLADSLRRTAELVR